MSFRSMAINSLHHDENGQVQAPPVSCPKGTGLNLALSPFTKQGIMGRASGSSKERNKAKNNGKTAYVSSDRMQLLSYHTKEKDDKKILSSFQLAANIYKSNSDEFKLKKMRRNNKKSVLTLPNEPQALPQVCTVSDMNDSEYFNRNDKQKTRHLRKRLPIQRTQRKQSPSKGYEYYDKEAKYCSQMNVYLDCSSTDVVKNFKGDGRKKPRSFDSETNSDLAPHNVWAVLRDINRFEFHPSPPMSDDSIKPRKKKLGKKKVQRGIYERCQTEQIAYISSIELMTTPRDCSLSGSSSEDRMTVINNEDSFSQIYGRVHTTFNKNVQQIRSKNKREKPRNQIKPCNGKKSYINNCKALCSPNQLLECETDLIRMRDKKDAVEEHSRMAIKNNASIETLIQEKSGKSMNSREISNTCFERDKQCLEVEIQTDRDLAQQGQTKPGINSKMTNCYNTTETRNAITKQNMNMPLRGPLLPPRVPWRNFSSTRPINTDSEPNKMKLTPRKESTISKLEENPIALPQSVTVTNNNPKHPMTRSDLLRTINKIKFPVVILGKDQVSGTFKVEEYDSPQFDGLDRHEWPFMRKWSDNTSKLNEPDRREYRNFARRRNDYDECNLNINGSSVNNPNRQIFCGKKYFSTNSSRLPQNNTDHVSNKNREFKQTSVAKLKPILQFRDRMLKLLYKKTSKQNIVDNGSLICIQEDMKTVKPVQVQVKNKLLRNEKIDSEIGNVSIKPPVSDLPLRIINPQCSSPPISPPNVQKTQKHPQTKRSWSKTKWASDFIENVMRKIKNGTYYNHELVCKSRMTEALRNKTNNNTNELNVQDAKELPIQPERLINSADLTPKITIQKKKEPPVMLPGFDDVSQQLEIESMTRNQIAVKHCIMNVVLQFDVNVPVENDQQSNNFKRSTSCIPVSVTDSKTKVYKCKTRILNALLPAELCSIIPMVMKQFLDKDKHPAVILHEENRINALSPVSEFSVPEIQGTSILPLLPSTVMSSIIKSELTSLKDGTFSKSRKLSTRNSEPYVNLYIIAYLPYELHSRVDALLLQRPKLNYQDYFVAHPHSIITNSTKQKPALTSIPSVGDFAPLTENLCRDLVPYTRNDVMYDGIIKTQSAPQTMFKEFFRMINVSMMNCVVDYLPSLPLMNVQTDKGNVRLDFSIGTHQGIGASVCINVTNLQFNPLYNATMTYSPTAVVNACFEKRIEYIKHAEDKEFKSKPRGKPIPNVVISKPKMRGSIRYVKLYKKCKSTSHISSENSSTSLSRVINLDEFFQSMGSSKLLSSVFDGCCGKKILSCVSALKNWITEITPRQALLVMLLTNKKDTSNLARLRPILLQGIAVNRITRVSELNMEIEVIERETFNELSELPGIPSSLESMQNNDNLFQELYWIAKTTASDYQMRFDESSEKLLRALLEKRKKLKPSYLRVMARYVGLGLLKTPANH